MQYSRDDRVTNTADFEPQALVRSAILQSILATKGPRRFLWRCKGSQMENVAKYQIIDAGHGIRLTGWYSPITAKESKGIVVLIHGWEGHHNSGYLYSMACCLFEAGYSVFRLNLRDHGGSQCLNRELFHAARIDEVIEAVRVVHHYTIEAPLFVVGFSLGGNFALRVAIHGPKVDVSPRLTIGISPAINPKMAVKAIDEGSPLIRDYFDHKWEKSLLVKKAAWPHFDFSKYSASKSIDDKTKWMVENFTEWDSLDSYYAAYTLSEESLKNAPSPVAIITAQDDPVIPFSDFNGLDESGSVKRLLKTQYGGHCGFLQDVLMRSWAEERVLEMLRLNS